MFAMKHNLYILQTNTWTKGSFVLRITNKSKRQKLFSVEVICGITVRQVQSEIVQFECNILIAESYVRNRKEVQSYDSTPDFLIILQTNSCKTKDSIVITTTDKSSRQKILSKASSSRQSVKYLCSLPMKREIVSVARNYRKLFRWW